MLAQRGIEVSYEAVRGWVNKFGPQIAKNLNRRKSVPSPRWNLDEMVCTIGGERMYLWRAVDNESARRCRCGCEQAHGGSALGVIGFGSPDASNLFDSDNFSSIFAPMLQWPAIDFGAGATRGTGEGRRG